MACDEWNVWYRTDDGQLEERYTLADALAVATWLNVFVRQSWTVRMANQARLVNALAPIVTYRDGLLSQAIYHPFQLMAAASEQVAVDTYTDSGAHIHGTGPGTAGLTGWATSACSSGSTWRPPPIPGGTGCRCRWLTAIRAARSGPASGCSTPARPG